MNPRIGFVWPDNVRFHAARIHGVTQLDIAAMDKIGFVWQNPGIQGCKDTRSKFIDTLLVVCLGWEEEDIRRELSSDGLRLDYLFSTTRPVLAIEAKKHK